MEDGGWREEGGKRKRENVREQMRVFVCLAPLAYHRARPLDETPVGRTVYIYVHMCRKDKRQREGGRKVHDACDLQHLSPSVLAHLLAFRGDRELRRRLLLPIIATGVLCAVPCRVA